MTSPRRECQPATDGPATEADDLLATVVVPQHAITPVAPSPAEEPPLPAVGTVLGGRYRLLACAGHGSTSVVYQAAHLKLNIPVAVKVVNLHRLADRDLVLRQLRSEALLLAQLNHVNLVRLWDFEDDADFPYLVTEFVEGRSLLDLIGEQGRVRPRWALDVMLQTAEGLAAAHKFGVVHRDVKPANILLSREGAAKLADLGLAVVVGQAINRAPDDSLTASSLAGTAAYLAPEQASAPAAVDHRADVYSLGATLYHAVTGRIPFRAASRMEVLRKHAEEPLTPPTELIPDLSPVLSDLIVRMMAKDPAGRFASYEELRSALLAAAGG